ncbi:MAG TPA: hypothetical protein VLU25_04755 [Acidobacteriota bacterium]|nr:hypothetical protein [Acidobacteriota bacterium]
MKTSDTVRILCQLSLCLVLVGESAASGPRQLASLDIENVFQATGWMGDGVYERKYVKFSGSYGESPHSKPDCIRIEYEFGPKGWAGIYWQNIADNWGEEAGNDYSREGFTKVAFWARGERGGEVVEFKTGGIRKGKYRDSFVRTSGRLRLSQDWSEYEIDLGNSDLSSVIGGFAWVASRDFNSAEANKIVFFIDDIQFQK